MSAEVKEQPKSLSFDEYDAIGFDVDHTLVKYKIPNLFNTMHDLMTDFLVSERNYPEEMKKPFSHFKDLCVRGLILDKRHGIFLKLSENGFILRATLGSTALNDEQIQDIYGDGKIFPWFKDLIETVDNLPPRFRIFENFFDMPGIVVTAKVIDVALKDIDIVKDEELVAKKMSTVESDVMDGFRHLYNHKNFADNKTFFKSLKEDPERFLEKTPEDVCQWLKKIRELNKVMFIVTSAYHDCAKFVLDHAYGTEWTDLFDFNATLARKPAFFSGSNPMYEVNDEGGHGSVVHEMKPNVTYLQGNKEILMKALKKKTGKDQPKILFFGDSLRSDVFPSKRFADWDNFLILEEMEAEDWEFHEHFEDSPKIKKYKSTEPSQDEKEYLTSLSWGSLFTDGKSCDDSPEPCMNTLWGYIIRKYADVAVPQLQYIAKLPMDHKFAVFNHESVRQWGFFPRRPNALENRSSRK
ncbi:DgyrCDS627 [Dimorphilus gyrociliatus]|uniref:DgyrCDS627 n=1 Tax=Dimorphilus gyrociliatus TaxID=2664684 RepID=A0A7I8V812_9ANNE|nr:DgyrCDS627 [Dimorphilus gyrociliatus]